MTRRGSSSISDRSPSRKSLVDDEAPKHLYALDEATRTKRLSRTRSGAIFSTLFAPEESYTGPRSGVLYDSPGSAWRAKLRQKLKAYKPFRKASGHYWQLDEVKRAFLEYQEQLTAALEEEQLSIVGYRVGILRRDPTASIAALNDRTMLTEDQAAIVRTDGACVAAAAAGDVKTLRVLCIAGAKLSDAVVRAAIQTNCAHVLRVVLQYAENVPLGALVEAADFPETFEVYAGYLSEYGELEKAAQDRKQGLTCVHVAVLHNRPDVIAVAAKFQELRAIVDAKTTLDMQLQSSKQTALHQACRYCHYDAAAALLEFMKASPHVVDVAGRAPIHVAAALGFASFVDLLLRFGASPTAKEKQLGRTPLELCALGAKAQKKSTTMGNQHGREHADYDACVRLIQAPPAVTRRRPTAPSLKRLQSKAQSGLCHCKCGPPIMDDIPPLVFCGGGGGLADGS